MMMTDGGEARTMTFQVADATELLASAGCPARAIGLYWMATMLHLT